MRAGLTPRHARGHAAPSHERWLVSYADFITLLFALFVVLFAASNADKEKVRTFAEAVENAIEHSGIRRSSGVPQARNLPQRNLERTPEPVLNSTYAALVESLETEVENHQVRVWLD